MGPYHVNLFKNKPMEKFRQLYLHIVLFPPSELTATFFANSLENPSTALWKSGILVLRRKNKKSEKSRRKGKNKSLKNASWRKRRRRRSKVDLRRESIWVCALLRRIKRLVLLPLLVISVIPRLSLGQLPGRRGKSQRLDQPPILHSTRRLNVKLVF